MGSKSKRRHAQKQYNRAQNKPPVAPVEVTTTEDEALATAAPIMTAKELRKAEKERQKNAKRLAKEQAKANKEANKNKGKKEKDPNKKPFFLIRFFRWIGRTCAEIGSELKKVHWPSFKQIMKSTGIVLAIVVGFGILLLGIWALLGFLHGLLIGG